MYRIDVWMFWNFMRKLIILYLLRIVLFQYWLNIDWKYTIHGYIRVGKLRSCLQGSLSQMWQKRDKEDFLEEEVMETGDGEEGEAWEVS